MAVTYEWDVETLVEPDTGENDPDIMSHNFFDTYKEALEYANACGEPWRICIVRDDDNGRSWAYIDYNTLKLPQAFEDAYQRTVANVPLRFHGELAARHKG